MEAGEDSNSMDGSPSELGRLRQQVAALTAERDRLRLVADLTYDWECWIAPDSTFRYCSPSCQRITGRPAREFLANPHLFTEIVHPDDRAAVAAHLADERDLPCSETLFFRILRADGEVRWIEHNCQSVVDEAGVFQGKRSSNRDVTDRRCVEETLQASEARYRELVQNANSAILRWGRDGVLTFANEYAQRFFGYSAQEIIGKHVGILVPDRESSGTDLSRLAEEIVEHPERFVNNVNENLCRDGRRVWMTWTNKAIFDREGRLVEILAVGSDISDRKRAEEERDRLARQRQLALDAAEMGWWHYDPSARIASWDDRYREIFQVAGYQGAIDEILARLHPDDLPAVWAKVEAALDPMDPQPYSAEYRIRLPDGSLRWVEAHGMAGFEGDAEDRRATSFVGTVADITGRKQNEEDLRRAKAAAEAANLAKSRFLANMSHELRTPMTGIMGMTDLALEQELPAKAREDLETVKASSQVLLALLNDVLDFSRIESGGFELEWTPFALRSTMDQTIKLLGVRAYEKGVELACDLPAEIPDRLVGDPLRLRQVVTNLVGNAIKFTQKGEVVVRGAVQERSEENVVLRFSVSDTGIGIPPDAIQQIFDPFVQGDASTARKFGGTGLGLAITRSLVERMGGRIWAESTMGCGATFHFTVRLSRFDGPLDESELLPAAREDLREVPVLVVAESLTTRQILEQMLGQWSMRPHSVPDVSAALVRLHEAVATGRPYRLVIADAFLPGVNGITLAGWLKTQPVLAGSMILMLSPTDRQAMAEQCSHLKVVCLEKPISQSELLAAVGKALGVGSVLPASRPAAASLSDRAARPLRVLLAEDTPANQKLVCRILERRGHAVDVASSGRLAIALLCQQHFDLILMDVQMPEMDGFQATRAIRALTDPRKARLPIVAMTAHALKGDQARCLEAGMDGYIPKPINARELVEAIERYAEATPRDGQSKPDAQAREAQSKPDA